MDWNVTPVHLIHADLCRHAGLHHVVLEGGEGRLVGRGLITADLGDDLVGVSCPEPELSVLAGEELPSVLIDRATVQLDVLCHLIDLAVRAEREITAHDDGEKMRDDKHLLELHSSHGAALNPRVDLRVVDALDGIHRGETEGSLERLAEDLVEGVLTLGELRLVAVCLDPLLDLHLGLCLTGGPVLEDVDSGRRNRPLVGTGHRSGADLVEELLDPDERLEVGIELLRSGSYSDWEHGVETLLVNRELLGLDALVLLREDEGRCTERGVDDLAEEPVVELLDRIQERGKAADLPGIALLDGIREP